MLVFFFFWFCLCFCGKIGFYFREKWNNQNALKLSFERLNCYACLRAFFVRITEWSLTCWLCESYGVYTAKMWWSHNFVSSGNGLFHWKWRSIQLSMNIIQQTNKQTDNNLLYWSVLSKETMSKCSKHYNETTCLQLVVPSDTRVLNILSSFNSPHKLRRVQTKENSSWFVKWPVNCGIHQVPL